MAAAETTLSLEGADAPLDEPPVPPEAEAPGATNFATLAGVSAATTAIAGLFRAPDATSATAVPPEASVAAAMASAAIPATARLRVDEVWRSDADGDADAVGDADGVGLQVGAMSPGAGDSMGSWSMVGVFSSRQG
jgi:hypothetical protein